LLLDFLLLALELLLLVEPLLFLLGINGRFCLPVVVRLTEDDCVGVYNPGLLALPDLLLLHLKEDLAHFGGVLGGERGFGVIFFANLLLLQLLLLLHLLAPLLVRSLLGRRDLLFRLQPLALLLGLQLTQDLQQRLGVLDHFGVVLPQF